MEVVGVEQLEAKQGENDLDRERTAIHKVAIEELGAAVKNNDVALFPRFGPEQNKPGGEGVALREGYVRAGL